MAGLVPAIHAFVSTRKVVDDRHKAGHDKGIGWPVRVIMDGPFHLRKTDRIGKV
jgi:hypothetical protein